MNDRTLIIGGPGTGKTTLAASMGEYRSSDEVMHLGWSESSAEVANWFNEPGPWVIEGVAVPRALRKWMQANPGMPPPVDRVIYLQTVHRRLSPQAKAMGKGVNTVLNQIMPWLSLTRVEIK